MDRRRHLIRELHAGPSSTRQEKVGRLTRTYLNITILHQHHLHLDDQLALS